jgi:dephospho-CoA kinase
MTPGELNQIDPIIRKKCFVVYLDIDRKVRESRIMRRNDNNDSIIRRLEADELDFSNFRDYDLKITDPEFEVDDIISLMD